MKYSKIALLIIPFVLAGCGEPKLDASSEEAMEASAAKVTEALNADKKAEFQQALQIVAFSKLDLKSVMSGEQTPEGVAGGMMASLDGKTADEVIAQAGVIKAERAAREKEQALKEIADLQAEEKAAEAAKQELAKFEVLTSRFFLREEEYSYSKKPIIQLSLRNGTSHAISRAYFKGTIASPGRAVPWLVEDFNYSIAGGIEPDESAEWSLAPNMFSDWGKVDAPTDAVFTVEVIKLDGPDGQVLFDSSGLSEYKRERLAELMKQYPDS